MFTSSTISITFSDILEQPEMFKTILQNLLQICETEIVKIESAVKTTVRKPRTRKVPLQEPVEQVEQVPEGELVPKGEQKND